MNIPDIIEKIKDVDSEREHSEQIKYFCFQIAETVVEGGRVILICDQESESIIRNFYKNLLTGGSHPEIPCHILNIAFLNQEITNLNICENDIVLLFCLDESSNNDIRFNIHTDAMNIFIGSENAKPQFIDYEIEIEFELEVYNHTYMSMITSSIYENLIEDMYNF